MGSTFHDVAPRAHFAGVALLLFAVGACGDQDGSIDTAGIDAGTGDGADSTRDPSESAGNESSGSSSSGESQGSSGPGTGDTDDDGTSGAGPGSDDGSPINPTWVLRGADGSSVEALVSPTCDHWQSKANEADDGSCALGEPGVYPNYPCVTVTTLGGVYWGATYRLSDGSPTACVRDLSGEEVDEWYYLQPDCSGPRFTGEVGMRAAFVEDGRLMYGSATAGIMESSVYYHRDYQNGVWGCHDVSSPLQGGLPSGQSVPIVEAPEDVLTALPDPPYTLAVEY